NELLEDARRLAQKFVGNQALLRDESRVGGILSLLGLPTRTRERLVDDFFVPREESADLKRTVGEKRLRHLQANPGGGLLLQQLAPGESGAGQRVHPK